ncbi:hypothetical protein BK122_09835 [Paenibacillus pabuli]|nr:hypothetical protein BK122_09835 [Paenibacillus pabuli]
MVLTFGKCLLRDCRTRANVTQTDLSEWLQKELVLSVSTTLLSLYENAKRTIPSLTMRGICIILECSENDMYEWP